MVKAIYSCSSKMDIIFFPPGCHYIGISVLRLQVEVSFFYTNNTNNAID